MSGSRWTLRCATWNLVGRCLTTTPQSCRVRRRRLRLSLTLLQRHLALRERERGAIRHGRRTPRYLRSSIACSRRPRRTSSDANTCRPSVDGGGRKQAGPQGRHEGSQLHRGSCRAAGGRSLVLTLAGLAMILHEGKVVLKDITRKHEEMNCVDKTTWCGSPRQWSSRTRSVRLHSVTMCSG